MNTYERLFMFVWLPILAIAALFALYLPGGRLNQHEWFSIIAPNRVIPIELKTGKVSWQIDYCVRHGEARVTRKELKK